MRPPLRAVLCLDEPAWRTALALAIGVFISCTPLYGLQTVLSLAAATALRLNRVAMVAGCWLNLPWFAPVVYGLALWVGGVLVPGDQGRAALEVAALLADARGVSWPETVALIRGVSGALVVGTLVVGACAAAATYIVAFELIRRRRGRGMMSS